MPKLKTHSGAAKRFHKTGSGKFKRGQSKMRHILTSKGDQDQTKAGRFGAWFPRPILTKVARMIPYA